MVYLKKTKKGRKENVILGTNRQKKNETECSAGISQKEVVF